MPFVVTFLLGAVLLWQVLQKASNEISIAFLEDIWSRNLLNVQVSPLSSVEYVTGLMLFALGKVAVAVMVMAGLAYALYGFGVMTLGVGLVPFMGGCCWCSAGRSGWSASRRCSGSARTRR
ncbi:hypothetical protein ACFSTC_30195 [Nonomuraea ferruginea]